MKPDWLSNTAKNYFPFLMALVGSFILLIVFYLLLDHLVFPQTATTPTPGVSATPYIKVALTIMALWIIILISYFTWAIHFYNVNAGYTNQDWETIYEGIRKRKAEGLEISADDLKQPENPYKDEALGIPSGAVRGTIALSMMVIGLVMLILFIGDASNVMATKYEFFSNAFLMMMAFYFGSRALEILTNKAGKNGTAAEPGGQEKATSLPRSTEETRVSTLPALSYERPVGPFLRTMGEPTGDLLIEYPQLQFEENKRKLSRLEIVAKAKELKLEPAVVAAVTKVESAGRGFLNDGRPKILFEGHIFWKELEKRNIEPRLYALEYPDIVYQHWSRRYYLGGEREYERLRKALNINSKAALCSASWGLFQIMGFNHQIVGFNAIEDFVANQHESEYEHLKAFCKYIEKEGLLKNLQEKKWKAFAEGYNGPRYAENRYDEKLAIAYRKYVQAGWNKDIEDLSEVIV